MLVRPSPRTALILLLSINLMNYVDRQILAALEKPIGEEFGVGPDATGWLPTAFFLAYMVFAPVFGIVADRASRWLIVGVGVIGWSLASGGSGAVNSFGLLILMRLLIGIGEAAYGPVAPTLIADMYPVNDRGRVLAWFYAAIPVGSALGYVVGGQFNPSLTTENSALWKFIGGIVGHDFQVQWHWAFYLTVPPGILLGAWALLMRDPAHDARKRGKNPDAATDVADSSSLQTVVTEGAESTTRAVASPKPRYRDLLNIRSYVLVSAGMTAMTFAVGGISFFMPRWLEGRGQSPDSATTIFGGIVVVSGLFATLLGGWAGDKLRNRFPGSYFLVSGGAMLLGFPLFLLMFVTPFPACWAVLFLTVFCLFFNTGPTNAIIANVTAPAVRATAFAMNIFVIHILGDVISPPIIGFIAKQFGTPGADGKIVPNLDIGFQVVGVAILLGGVCWLAGAKSLEADTANASRTA